MNDLEKEVKRLSNLVNYKNYDKSSLEKIAQVNVWRRQADIDSKFENPKDKKLANELFDNYLDNYEFTTYDDITNIVDLVYEEVLKTRVQQQIDNVVNDEKTKYVPDRLISSLHNIEERIWSLKEKAGIVGKKDVEDLTALEELQEKFKTYIAFNRNEFTFYSPIVCKKCGEKDVQPILLRKRVKNYNALKHPFFSGRFYYNRRGMELVKAGIWTKEEYAWVFNTSVKYIDWCLENENKIVEIDGIEEKEIQKFINNKPYLQKPSVPDNISKDKRKK